MFTNSVLCAHPRLASRRPGGFFDIGCHHLDSSCFSPLMSLNITRGLDTAILQPSRRMFSSRMVSCFRTHDFEDTFFATPADAQRHVVL
jgi:hypothetical protein